MSNYVYDDKGNMLMQLSDAALDNMPPLLMPHCISDKTLTPDEAKALVAEQRKPAYWIKRLGLAK